MHSIRFLSQVTFSLGIVLPIMTACSDSQPVTFAGDLTPLAGVCEPAGRAVLVKRGKYVDFTPSQGVLILHGQIAPDGQVKAQAQTVSADRKPYPLTLAAKRDGSEIGGTYVTPRCRYAVKLSESP